MNDNLEQDNLKVNKSPLSFLSGSLTSLILALVSFFISRKLMLYFSIHMVNSDSQLVQSISTGLRTLIVGSSFLATFSFLFIGLGLFLLFIRSFFNISTE
tara:strand:+ start:5170 stop:5469 length:300 start_codon:yes stop_codon:yes gene_type:complete